MIDHKLTFLSSDLDPFGNFAIHAACDTAGVLVQHAQYGATARYEELRVAIADATSVETEAMREVERRRVAVAATEGRIAELERRPDALKDSLESALEAGADQFADEAEAELATVESSLHSARQRLRIERRLLAEAESAAKTERTRTIEAIRAAKRSELAAVHDELAAELNDALSRLYPQIVFAGWALASCDAGFRPVYAPPPPRVESEASRQRREEVAFQKSLPPDSPYRDFTIDTGEPRPQAAGVMSLLTSWIG